MWASWWRENVQRTPFLQPVCPGDLPQPASAQVGREELIDYGVAARARNMPLTRRGAHEAVDEETREQEELAELTGVPIFLPQDVREDRWVLVDTSDVDTRCGKPAVYKGYGGWPTKFHKFLDPTAETDPALRAFFDNVVVREVDGAMIAAVSVDDFKIQGSEPSFDTSHGDSMIGATYGLDRNGNVRAFMVWQLRVYKLLNKKLGYQGSQELSTAVNGMLGSATRYLIVRYMKFSDAEWSFSAEAAAFIIGSRLFKAHGMFHVVVQCPLGQNIMNRAVRAALQACAAAAELKGKVHPLAYLLDLEDGAELDVSNALRTPPEVREAFSKKVSIAVKIAMANLSPESQAAMDAGGFTKNHENDSDAQIMRFHRKFASILLTEQYDQGNTEFVIDDKTHSIIGFAHCHAAKNNRPNLWDYLVITREGLLFPVDQVIFARNIDVLEENTLTKDPELQADQVRYDPIAQPRKHDVVYVEWELPVRGLYEGTITETNVREDDDDFDYMVKLTTGESVCVHVSDVYSIELRKPLEGLHFKDKDPQDELEYEIKEVWIHDSPRYQNRYLQRMADFVEVPPPDSKKRKKLKKGYTQVKSLLNWAQFSNEMNARPAKLRFLADRGASRGRYPTERGN